MKTIIFTLYFIILSNMLFSIDFSTGDNYGVVNFFRTEDTTRIVSDYEIMINQSIIIDIKNNSYFELKLDPGTYLIHIQQEKLLETRTTKFDAFKLIVKPGEEINIEIKSIFFGVTHSFLSTKPFTDSYNKINIFNWAEWSDIQ